MYSHRAASIQESQSRLMAVALQCKSTRGGTLTIAVEWCWMLLASLGACPFSKLGVPMSHCLHELPNFLTTKFLFIYLDSSFCCLQSLSFTFHQITYRLVSFFFILFLLPRLVFPHFIPWLMFTHSLLLAQCLLLRKTSWFFPDQVKSIYLYINL